MIMSAATLSIVRPEPILKKPVRINSIDALRGLVMVLMALDHARDFLHVNGMFYDPTDLTTTTPVLFVTRLLTHLCAPTFVFLSGVSAFLSGQKKNRQQLVWFLISRGLWMILLELTVINFAYYFDTTFSRIDLQVMWAIGISMIVLSGFIFLPWRITFLISLALVLGHNALDGLQVPVESPGYWLWAILHERAVIPLSPSLTLTVLYPVLPWIGIMGLGYCVGPLFGRKVDPNWRWTVLVHTGLGSLIGFVLFRLANVYGDPMPWQPQQTALFTVLSFFNVTKYPPSLAYILLMLGVALLLLHLLEIRQSRWMDWLIVYGRVPLFYYVIHHFMLHGLAVLRLLWIGYDWSAINFQNGTGGLPEEQGLSLPMTYLTWILVVVSLYPVCEWYYSFKSRQKGIIWNYL